MSNKTITKNPAFVISLILFSHFFSGCYSVSSTDVKNGNNSADNTSTTYRKSQIVGNIESKEITESSGIVESKCQQDVFWTHNDSGDAAFIYAFSQKGKKLGTWKVLSATNDDWEDIAAFRDEKSGKCMLYIGDIGNNERLKSDFTIYRISEPQISEEDNNSTRKKPSATAAAEEIRFQYPDMRHDAEALLVHPKTGDMYILSKRFSGAAGVYKLEANFSSEKPGILKKIGDFSVPAVPNGLLTGGDISSDGKRVVICDYFSAYEIVLPEEAKNFDEIWTQKPSIVELGERSQGEAVAYSADGTSIFATSEKKNSPIIKAERK